MYEQTLVNAKWELSTQLGQTRKKEMYVDFTYKLIILKNEKNV